MHTKCAKIVSKSIEVFLKIAHIPWLKESNTKLAHALSVVLAQDRELEGMKKNLE